MHDVVVYRMKEMKVLTAEMKYMPDQYFEIKITLTLSQSHNSQDINNLPREIQTCLRHETYISSQVIIIRMQPRLWLGHTDHRLQCNIL